MVYRGRSISVNTVGSDPTDESSTLSGRAPEPASRGRGPAPSSAFEADAPSGSTPDARALREAQFREVQHIMKLAAEAEQHRQRMDALKKAFNRFAATYLIIGMDFLLAWPVWKLFNYLTPTSFVGCVLLVGFTNFTLTWAAGQQEKNAS